MEDLKPLTILRIFAPKVPLVVRSTLAWLSSTSTKWDLRTELTIQILRSFLSSSKPMPISKQQRLFKDPGIKGPLWISKVTLPPPPEALLDLLVAVIDSMKTGSEQYDIAPPATVQAEWTGHRSNAHAEQARPDLSEAQHYERLMSEVSSDTTILYLHGGAYYLGDPSGHRTFTAKLASLTGGRCFSVRYRLSPQHAFPAVGTFGAL